MKKHSKLILLVLCAIIAAETVYILIFPCTWGYSLYIDDTYIGSLKEEQQLSDLLESLKEPYLTPNTVSCEFVETVNIQKEKFLKGQLSDTSEQIISALNSIKRKATQYHVRKGDTWSQVAENHGLTSEELLAMNPGHNINKMQIGDVLIIAREVPLVSVVTVEQQTYTEEIPFQWLYCDSEQNLVDPALDPYAAFGPIIRVGKYGTAEVTANITYINGFESSQEILSSEIIVAPIDQVTQLVDRPDDTLS